MRKSECGLRPVGVIGAYAPEGMRKDGVAALCLFLKFLFRFDRPFFLAGGGACMKLHRSQCHFHEVGGHSPPYGALKTFWRNVGWAAPTMIATGRSRPAVAL